jgi:predicted O-methyltransferase YrrM
MELNLDNIPTAWAGHRVFANWLNKHLQPQVTVELGVDRGYSLFALAENSPGEVYGIDLFEGDQHAGQRDSNEEYARVLEFVKENQLNNVHVIQDDWHNTARTWNKKIDLLHIDGVHTTNAVIADFNSWCRFLSRKSVVLFHDIDSFNDVYIAVQAIATQLSNQVIVGGFIHSAGLGVLCRDRFLFAKIIHDFPNFVHPGNVQFYIDNPEELNKLRQG